MRNVLTALDVGTSKVCVLVAEPLPEGGGATVLGYGVAPCTGLRKGVVVNIEATVEASRAGDLPILSGAAVQTAGAPDLVRYAAALVRSEVALSGLVSEMRLDGDGTVSLFFDRSHTELRVDLDDAPAQLKRATEVLGQWRGHEQLVAMVDMTTPGQAVMRLRGTAPLAAAQGSGTVRRVAARTRAGGGIRASGGGRR